MRALMTVACVGLSLFFGTGCKRTGPGSEPAPFGAGTMLEYAVQETSPGGGGGINYNVKVMISAGETPEDLVMSFESNRGSAEPIAVNTQLQPDDKIITAFGLGRVWIPENSRRAGVITDCGRSQQPRKFQTWDVWEMDGRCGLTDGARYYDATTGVLVGFQISKGGSNHNGKLISGP